MSDPNAVFALAAWAQHRNTCAVFYDPGTGGKRLPCDCGLQLAAQKAILAEQEHSEELEALGADYQELKAQRDALREALTFIARDKCKASLEGYVPSQTCVEHRIPAGQRCAPCEARAALETVGDTLTGDSE